MKIEIEKETNGAAPLLPSSAWEGRRLDAESRQAFLLLDRKGARLTAVKDSPESVAWPIPADITYRACKGIRKDARILEALEEMYELGEAGGWGNQWPTSTCFLYIRVQEALSEYISDRVREMGVVEWLANHLAAQGLTAARILEIPRPPLEEIIMKIQDAAKEEGVVLAGDILHALLSLREGEKEVARMVKGIA